MRSIKLTAAIAAAAMLLALSASSASARPLSRSHARSSRVHIVLPSKHCRISLLAEPHAITSGESVELFGRLHCTASTDEGQTVTIYGSSVHAPGLHIIRIGLEGPPGTILGTATTGAGGFYSFVDADVTTDSTFHASALGITSARRMVKVAPVVTLAGPSEVKPLFTGFRNRVTFTGAVSPADAGAVLALQREDATSKEEWHLIQLGVVGPGGVYSISHTFKVPGDANLRIVVRRHRQFTVRGISNTLSYGISQKENPSLTINTTAYTVPYGSPVTISGVLASGAGKTVTLQAHTSGKELTTVASIAAGSGGEYKIVVTPLQNTRYDVTGGGETSTVLFEGVKYLLTAGVSAKTVQSGQPLTFAGTVTPGNAGKPVYLERENHLGGGFHVVDVGSVTAGGTYSITDFLFGTGKLVLRVKVSGDPDNQQVSSEPFPVEVTPAPPATLKPVVQPKGPIEGTV